MSDVLTTIKTIKTFFKGGFLYLVCESMQNISYIILVVYPLW